MIEYLILGLTLGLSASATPGPFQAYLLSQTIKNGWRKTLLAAFAPLLSDGPIITLVVLILTQTPVWLLIGIQIAGGGFIIYLAWGAYRTLKHYDFEQMTDEHAEQQSLLEAAIMNFLNPNPYIYWGTIGGPLLIEAWQQTTLHAISFIGGFYLLLIGGFVVLIILFGTTRHLGPQVTRILTFISALALFVFGLYQIGKGIDRLIAI